MEVRAGTFSVLVLTGAARRETLWSDGGNTAPWEPYEIYSLFFFLRIKGLVHYFKRQCNFYYAHTMWLSLFYSSLIRKRKLT